MNNKQSKGISTIWIMIIIVLALALGIWGGYYYFKNQGKETTTVPTTAKTTLVSTTSTTTTPSPTTTNKTSGWQTYTNDVFGYSFQYPSDYKVSDQCYDTSQKKKIDYEPTPKWLVLVAKNMEENFPYCESDFPQMDLVIRGSSKEIDINEQLEYSDTDIESEEKVSGITWTKQVFTEPSEFDGSYSTSLFVNHNGKGYHISLENDDAQGNHSEIIDQIVSTFKFSK